MFGFRKKSKADAAIAVMPQVIEIAAEKWVLYCDRLIFKADVPLADRIASFTVPFFEGARKNVKALKDAPDVVLLLIVVKGIELSGTHSRAELEEALGVPIPS